MDSSRSRDQHDVALVGGDTTRGPLSICVTVHGLVDPDARCDATRARVGDDSGSPARSAMRRRRWCSCAPGGAADAALRARLDRPTPRIDSRPGLVGIAHAGIDLSDGLLADLGHVCRAAVSAPRSSWTHCRHHRCSRRASMPRRGGLQASGGDDYELCFTAAPTQRDAIARLARGHDVAITRVGRIVAGSGVGCVDADGQPWHAPRSGYVHFAD